MSTIDALIEIAKNLGPAATGVGGALATLWKTTHGIFNRLKGLEDEAAKCRQRFKQVTDEITSLNARLNINDNSTRTLDAGFREFEHALEYLKSSLSNYVTHTSNAKTLERLAAAERRASELEEELDRLDRTLVNFAREQNEQWQSINRSLGQLEGYIKGRTSIADG